MSIKVVLRTYGWILLLLVAALVVFVPVTYFADKGTFKQVWGESCEFWGASASVYINLLCGIISSTVLALLVAIITYLKDLKSLINSYLRSLKAIESLGFAASTNHDLSNLLGVVTAHQESYKDFVDNDVYNEGIFIRESKRTKIKEDIHSVEQNISKMQTALLEMQRVVNDYNLNAADERLMLALLHQYKGLFSCGLRKQRRKYNDDIDYIINSYGNLDEARKNTLATVSYCTGEISKKCAELHKQFYK